MKIANILILFHIEKHIHRYTDNYKHSVLLAKNFFSDNDELRTVDLLEISMKELNIALYNLEDDRYTALDKLYGTSSFD